MKLLTFDNAKSLLEKGEVYRIGYNALNEGEFLYEHKGFKRKNPSYAAHVNKGNVLYLNGTVTWLDKIDLGTMETDYRFYSSKAKTIQDLTNADYRFQIGAFTAWNGEPLWLLDDYESTDDIYMNYHNQLMLPDICKEVTS
jgi:hypothetical protein